MNIEKTTEFLLKGHVKCQSCENIFPKEFSDKCLGWYGSDERYTPYELAKNFGIFWKNYDEKGQWYLWDDKFICPECAQKLIDSGEAELKVCYYESFTTCDYDELPEEQKKYAKPHKWQDKSMPDSGSDIKMPYNVLYKVSKRKKKTTKKDIDDEYIDRLAKEYMDEERESIIKGGCDISLYDLEKAFKAGLSKAFDIVKKTSNVNENTGIDIGTV